MKRAKEFYNENEYPKQFTKLTNTGISNDFENVFEFAEKYAKALLEEAAEKANKLGCDEKSEYCEGYNYGLFLLQEFIKSLIPKEETK